MNGENKKLVEDYLYYYNNKDVNNMINLFSEDVIFESVSNSEGVTRTENKDQLYKLALSSVKFFSDRNVSVISWTISENNVAAEIKFYAKIAKNLPNGLKAGDEIFIRGASFFTIKNNKIIKLTDYM